MAPIITHADNQPARRTNDPLNYVWGWRYTQLTIPFKILTWISSLVLSVLLLAVIGGIAFMVLWGIGILIYNIFRAIYHGIIFFVNPIIDAAKKLGFGFGEGRGRRREREDEGHRQRERGPGSGMRGRSRNGRDGNVNVVNVHVRLGEERRDVEMGRVGRLNGYDGRGMTNMGPQRMDGLDGRPPAYWV